MISSRDALVTAGLASVHAYCAARGYGGTMDELRKAGAKEPAVGDETAELEAAWHMYWKTMKQAEDRVGCPDAAVKQGLLVWVPVEQVAPKEPMRKSRTTSK